MLHNDNVYLITNKFYTVPAYEDYLQEKNNHLIRIDPDYQNKSPQEKWSLLMAQFDNSLQDIDMPNVSLEAFKNTLSAFKLMREQTSTSLFNLSLTQCVNYFEEFLFLYTTTDARYQLKPTEKKALLQSIHEAIGTCETGINGRFYTTLQDFRKDSDWILNEMSKTRCEVLRQLQHNFGGGPDVHIYNKLIALANKEHLGIPTKEEILDIHAGMVDARALEAFFAKEYPKLYETYEKQIIVNLTNHYLSELTSTLEINASDWDAGPVTLSSEQARVMQRSIDGHFQGINLEQILYSFVEISDDYDQYTLKTKKDAEQIIKRLVTEKLLADQYYVSLNAVSENRAAYPNLRISKGVSVDSLMNVHESLQQNDSQQIANALSQNSQALLCYPELILSQIKSKSSILFNIPRWLKADTRFLDAAIVILDQMLCQAIGDEDNETIDRVTSEIVHLIGSENNYLQTLSQPILQNPRVAKKLVENNPLFIGYIDVSLQNNQELQALAQEADLFGAYDAINNNVNWSDKVVAAHFRMLRDSIPSEYSNLPGLARPTEYPSYHQALTNFLRVKAFILLIHPGQLSASNTIDAINKVNPDLLLKAIEYRKINHLPPLPFFDNDKTVNELRNFNQDIETRLNPDWSQPLLAIRRRACEQENFESIRNPFSKKNALTYLSKTTDWFTGFKQYQTYQTSREKLWLELIAVANAYYEFVITLIKTCFYYYALVYVLPIISAIIRPYFFIGLLICLAISAINYWFIGNRLLATANDILWRIIFFDLEFLIIMGSLLILSVVNAAYQLYDIMNTSYVFLRTLANTTLSCFGKDEHIATSLEDACEHTLVRLDSIDEVSAQEKSDLLRALLLQIKADANEQGLSFKEQLDQKYTIIHHAQEHHVSFSEVASKRRAHHGEFKLEPQPDWMRFFGAMTTTEAFIAKEYPVHGG